MKRNLLFLMLLSLFAYTSAFAQGRKISGKVVSADDGQPLPGVAVKIQGTQQGVLTDGDGNFYINATVGQTLVFSYVGFTTQTLVIPAETLPVVKLKTDARTLSEVVIVDSYGVQAKKAYTGSASVVNGAENEQKPFSTPQQALQGEVAGLQATVNSGQPGAAVNVHIRGINSTSLDQNPLYVIDGMLVNSQPFQRVVTTTNPLSGINEDDIESVTVLKDAAATAIYGSRGANGVIIITTKKGKSGKTQINVDAEAGTTSNLPLPTAGKPVTGAQYATLFNEALTNAGYSAATVASQDVSYGISGPGNNWYDLVTKNGSQQQYNVSMNGGTDITRVYSSVGYFSQDATTIGSNLKRVTGTLNLDHNISKRFSISTNLQFSNVNQNTPSNSGLFANPILAAYFLRPFQNPYNADGSINTSYTGNTNFSSIYNPLWLVGHDKKYDSQTHILGAETLKWNIWDQLKFTSFASVDYNVLEEQEYLNPTLGDGRTYGGQGYAYYTRYFNWVVRNQLDYRYNIPHIEDFYVDASLGYEAQDNKEYYISAYGTGFPATQPTLTALGNAVTPVTASDGFQNRSFDGLYSRASINYKNLYSLSGSFRRDGSSVFGTSAEFGNFWSIGGTVNIDQEPFFKNQNIFSMLKLRSSYGTVGNANGLSAYGWRPTASYSASYGYAGYNGQQYATVGNALLSWETQKKFDVGTDFGFFKDRLTFSVDYYDNNVSGLISNEPISYSTGFANVQANVGALTNKGVEVAIKGIPIKTRDFTWTTSFNFSHNASTVTQTPNNFSGANGNYYWAKGFDYYTFYVKLYAGVNPANGDALWYTDGTKTATTTNYSTAKYSTYGQGDPKIFGGWSNTFNYKGIQLTADFYYNFGNMIYDSYAAYLNAGAYYTYGKYQYVYLNRWTTPGQITDVPKYVAGGIKDDGGNDGAFSTRYFYYGDYIRLKNITLGYNFKDIALLKHLGVTKLYLYGRVTNLWTKTYDKRLPFDPEVGYASGNTFYAGASNIDVPQIRTATIGLNVGF